MAQEGLSSPIRFGESTTLADGEYFRHFLDVWGGEVLLAFRKKTLLRRLLRVKTISHGKSASFPAIGKATAVYHTPGENLIMEGAASPKYLSQIGNEEKRIFIDGFLTAQDLIYELDEDMSHYGVRAPFINELAEALAVRYDRHLMQVLFNGSEQSATMANNGSWSNGGIQLTDSDFHTSATSAKGVIKDIAQTLTERDVPDGDRFIIVDPQTYYNLADLDAVVSADFNTNTGGDRGLGKVNQLHGIHIFMTPRLAELRALGNVASADAQQNGAEYTGDFSNCRALFGHLSCAGTVELRKMTTDMEWKPEYIAQFVSQRLACGHGVLRPDVCGSVITS